LGFFFFGLFQFFPFPGGSLFSSFFTGLFRGCVVLSLTFWGFPWGEASAL